MLLISMAALSRASLQAI